MGTELQNKYNPDGSELRKLQLKMLQILEEVTALAEKHKINYWLSGGTLLGAIRHGGFIPWDDDIDIEMLHSDYLRFLKILEKELPDSLYLQTPNEKGYRLLFTKVRDKFSIVTEDDESLNRLKERGIYIDIFPEERSYRWMKNIVDFFYGRAFRRLKREKPFYSVKYFYEYTTACILYPIGFTLSKVARMICTITKPDNILHSYGIGNSTNHNIKYILPLSKVTFEGKLFNAPKDANVYLNKQYGDYMKIPDINQRNTHFLKVEYKNKI